MLKVAGEAEKREDGMEKNVVLIDAPYWLQEARERND